MFRLQGIRCAQNVHVLVDKQLVSFRWVLLYVPVVRELLQYLTPMSLHTIRQKQLAVTKTAEDRFTRFDSEAVLGDASRLEQLLGNRGLSDEPDLAIAS